jgi:hypothetical protein
MAAHACAGDMEFVRVYGRATPDRARARPYRQCLAFVKRFRELAEFSIAMGRRLQQFSEKSGCSLLKNGHFDGLCFQG